MGKSDLELLIGDNESIVWRGKPDFKCFVLESIFNPMLFFALIWGGVDFTILGFALKAPMESNDGSPFSVAAFLLVFFALHLMPVWMYLGGVIFSVLEYKHTEYIITDKAIYVLSGKFTINTEMKPFTDLSHINIHRGVFDQMIGVGDVITECNHTSYSGNSHSSSHRHGISLCDLRDYAHVFEIVKKLQTDIYSDTMFPNDMRPQENHGYNTTYKGF